MANLAQTVNVHQDATLLETIIENGAAYVFNDESLPQLSVSASKDDAGAVHVSLCNLDSRAAADVTFALTGVDAIGSVPGRLVTATAMQAHNTFSQPEAVIATTLQSLSHDGQQVKVQLPPMVVAVVAI